MRVIVSLSVILSFVSCQKLVNIEIAQLKTTVDSLIVQNNQLSNSLRCNYILGFNQINPNAKLINEEFDTVDILNVFGEPYTLVFYYSNYACSPCLDRELIFLRSQADSIKNSELCIIGATRSMRSIAAVIRNYDFQCNLYQLEGVTGLVSGFPFMQESVFLIVDSHCIIRALLVPPKNDEQTLQMFFNFIKSKFLNNGHIGG
jgi:hypothetical protein